MTREARDYTGKLQPMPKPHRGKCIASYEDGIIELWRTTSNPNSFAVVYGLQMESGLNYNQAALEIGRAILHVAQCEGKLD